ncbi:uncharacterized protein LOC111377713 [Olea europaea var. sylvestris]|uniref:uncharacterized protein LOC111377713 n=1 Tax=Olea europaea var. sylvestris TaxID=158386 RepID=UPI000C1D3F48|nr:uncharacterized protein LOC111377713 [Olea europaea var. sylvestris]
MVDPRENVSAILLKSGKKVEISRGTPTSLEQEKKKDVLEEKSVPNDNGVPKPKFSPISAYEPAPPFPQALVEPRKDEHNHELYEAFRKCKKLKRCEKINVGENISAIIQRNLPTKCKDLGMFSIPCTIGNTRFEKTMLD